MKMKDFLNDTKYLLKNNLNYKFIIGSKTVSAQSSVILSGSTIPSSQLTASVASPLFSSTAGTDVEDDLFEDYRSTDYVPYSERPETYIIPVVFFLIWLIGILGNGTLVIIFLRHRSMRNIPNTYIFSLAMADLLVILICVPFVGTIYTFESWLWGSSLCRLTEWAKDVSIGVSVFTLCALSADRYCAVVNPLRKLQTKPITVIVAILIWFFAILCALPAALISDTVTHHITTLHNKNSTITYCSPFGPEKSYTVTYKKYNTVIKAIVYYFFPLLMIAILYALMAKRLHVSAREMPGNAGPQSRSQARARRHVARMVIAFIIVFIICFLPYHVFELWFNLYPKAQDEFDDSWHIFRIVGFILSFLNSCLNPVALYCVSGVFRQHFHRYLCCRPIAIQHRSGLSAAGGETSFMSTIRRSNQNNQSIRKSISTHSIHNVDKS